MQSVADVAGIELDRLRRIRLWCQKHNEADFQGYLAERLCRFGWTAHREVKCVGQSGRPRRIDILAVPPDSWEHRATIPAVGIETKMNHGFGIHNDEFVGKLNDYIVADKWWLAGGTPHDSPLPKPAIVLYATPHSVGMDRAVYDWNDQTMRQRVLQQVEHLAGRSAEEAIRAAIDLTQLEAFALAFDRDLWKRGAAILHGPWDRQLWFQTNRFGPSTPKYYLGEAA